MKRRGRDFVSLVMDASVTSLGLVLLLRGDVIGFGLAFATVGILGFLVRL